MNYAFLLGREFKLSIAEIQTVFPEGKTVFCNRQILILDGLDTNTVIEKVKHLGGTIKVFELNQTQDTIEESICNIASGEGKFKYGLSVYGERKNLKEILLKIKKQLKVDGISSRYTNKENKNLTSAQILGENLVSRGTDFNYIYGEKNYFG